MTYNGKTQESIEGEWIQKMCRKLQNNFLHTKMAQVRGFEPPRP